jgi:hypothetical protein
MDDGGRVEKSQDNQKGGKNVTGKFTFYSIIFLRFYLRFFFKRENVFENGAENDEGDFFLK